MDKSVPITEVKRTVANWDFLSNFLNCQILLFDHGQYSTLKVIHFLPFTLYGNAIHYNILVMDTCPTCGQGDVIISLTQELNILPI